MTKDEIEYVIFDHSTNTVASGTFFYQENAMAAANRANRDPDNMSWARGQGLDGRFSVRAAEPTS